MDTPLKLALAITAFVVTALLTYLFTTVNANDISIALLRERVGNSEDNHEKLLGIVLELHPMQPGRAALFVPSPDTWISE